MTCKCIQQDVDWTIAVAAAAAAAVVHQLKLTATRRRLQLSFNAALIVQSARDERAQRHQHCDDRPAGPQTVESPSRAGGRGQVV